MVLTRRWNCRSCETMNAPSLTHSFPTFRLGPLSRMPTFQNKAKARMFIRWIPIIGLAALAVYALLFGGPLPSREEDQEPTPPTSAASPPASPAPPPSAASVLDKWLKPARQPTIDPVFSGDPPHSGVYCKMVNEGDFETSWFKETEPWNGPASRKHRKQHEMAYIPYVVQQLGLCGKNKRGLVFAAGREPLPSLFACQGGCSILATDFDPAAAARTGWTSTGQWSGRREELFRDEICKNKTFFDDRVEYRTADMNHIDPALHGQFDFVWSTCSVGEFLLCFWWRYCYLLAALTLFLVEHVGSILLGQRFVLNSLDLLKPGGVAIHTVGEDPPVLVVIGRVKY